MDKINVNKAVQELTLVLMYLTSWEERPFFEGEKVLRAWKGYDWGALDELDESGYINKGSVRSKSVYLSPEGEAYANELLEKLGYGSESVLEDTKIR